MRASLPGNGGEPGRADHVLEVEGVAKSFPGAAALRSVSLAVRSGEVHALLGENGAGKSTLIKIATGALAPDAGEVRIDGVPLHRASPRLAQQLGVRVIHQERQIALDLSAAENVLLDRLPARRLGFTGRRLVERAAADQLAALGIDIDVRTPVRELTVAEHQLLEIARAVSFDARVVVMDEPTASLHRDEVRVLFSIIERLTARGVSVLFISHHLDEVFAIADRVTVLRDGVVAGTRPIDETTAEELLSLIFGQAVNASRPSVRAGWTAAPGGDAVVARGVRYRQVLRDVSLTVRSGEIVALTGSLGSGASELAGVLAGAVRADSGTVDYPTLALDRRARGRSGLTRAGVGFLPADRKREGLLLERSVADNIALASLVTSRRVIRRPSADRRRARAVVERLAIKVGDVGLPVRTLSGGNQQKTVLGRWLEVGSSVLVFDEPTAGVDIASKLELYRCLFECAADGAAILVVSSDYEEIHAVADRVVVLRDGVIVGELPGDVANAERLVHLEMGA